jgi:hypothetical protein
VARLKNLVRSLKEWKAPAIAGAAGAGWLVGHFVSRRPPPASRLVQDPATGNWRYVEPRPGDLPDRLRAVARALDGIAEGLRHEEQATTDGALRQRLTLASRDLRTEATRIYAIAETVTEDGRASAA